MLEPIISAIKTAIPFVIIISGIVVVFISIFWEAKWGLLVLIGMIPQANIWMKLEAFPMGKDFLDILFIAVMLGMIFQKKGFENNGHVKFIIIFLIVSYLSLWNCSFNFGLAPPISTDNKLLMVWKNYAQMIFMYFLTFNIAKAEKEQLYIVLMMIIVLLFVSLRAFRGFTESSSFDYGRRYGGPFEPARLGANHFGAFVAHFWALAVGMLVLDKDKKRRMLYAATCLFALHPLFFSYSRGAYAGAGMAALFYGLTKKRVILIGIVAVALSYSAILPKTVVERIQMTTSEDGNLEHSAAARLDLWVEAIDMFKERPIFGWGFDGFSLRVPDGEDYNDTHNLYLKFASEQGMIGVILLALIFVKSFSSGLRLYKVGKSDFLRATGLGFMGCVVALLTTNAFGDRFSYFVMGTYFWALWGVVDRAIIQSQQYFEKKEEAEESPSSVLRPT